MLNSTKYILLFTLLIPVAQADDILDVQSRIRKGELKDNPSTAGGFALPRVTKPKKPVEVKKSKPIVKPSRNLPFAEKKAIQEEPKSVSNEKGKSSAESLPEIPKSNDPSPSKEPDKESTSDKFKKALEERQEKGKDKWSIGSGSKSVDSKETGDNSGQLIKRKAEIERILEADSKTSFGSISISKKARLKKELKEINRQVSKSAPVDEDDVLRHTESVIDKVRKSSGMR